MTNGFYYEFGEYRLNLTEKSLWRDNQVVSLTPKQIEILLLLLENGGNTVSRDKFFNLIWGGTFVEESNLTQNIFQLRKTLSENHEKSEFIETVPKRGYRFVAPIRKLENNPQKNDNNVIGEKTQIIDNRRFVSFRNLAVAVILIGLLSLGYFFYYRTRNSAEPNISDSSIAILPFKEIGNQTNDKQLEVGLADALITKLSGLKKISVRPTSSILQVKQTEAIEIGKELRVETILSGTIQRDNEVLRVTVQLVKVKDGSTLWAEKYDSSAKNIFEIQDDISEKILRTLKNQINSEDNQQISKRHTNNQQAFEAYSRGRYFWATGSNTNLDKALEYFQKAIALDPNYALAYSGLADAQIFYASGITGTPLAEEYKILAKQNTLKALELDSSLAEPHSTLAAIIFEETGNWAATENEFLKAIELNPNYETARMWYSLHLLTQNEFAKSEAEMKKALEIDPVSASMVNALGQVYYFNRQYDLAIEQFEKALELDPAFTRAKVYLSLALIEAGKKEQALEILVKVSQLNNQHSGVKTALGFLYANLGRKKEAENILIDFEKIKNSNIFDKYAIAMINAELGNTDKAFNILEEISKFRNLSLIVRLKFDPRLNFLRQEKRFEKLQLQ